MSSLFYMEKVLDESPGNTGTEKEPLALLRLLKDGRKYSIKKGKNGRILGQFIEGKATHPLGLMV